jgi:hypothetical protein
MASKDEWEQDRRPIAEVLGGLAIHPLAEGERAESAFVIIKTVDDDGEVNWVSRRTGWNEPSDEELIGVLTIQLDLERRDALAAWAVDDDDEDA